jgi:hypothetical protein
VTGAAFIGIGAMIGAGIFALLGETGLSLLLAGVVTIDYIWKRVRPATPVPSAESQLTP